MEALQYYGDGYGTSSLLPLLSEKFDVAQKHIIQSQGAEQFLQLVLDRIGRGKTLLTHAPHSGIYDRLAQLTDMRVNHFPIREEGEQLRFAIDECIEQCRSIAPALVIITSPNLPTGNSIDPDDIRRIARTMPRSSLLIIDQVYAGFDPTHRERKCLPLLKKLDNLVLLRSFSKYYALAGCRIGYALCGKSVKNILRYEHPSLGMSPVIEQIAIAALQEEDYYERSATNVIGERERMRRAINAYPGFRAYRSDGNFFLVRVEKPLQATFSSAIDRVQVVTVKHGFEDFWRISVHRPATNTRLLRVMKHISER